MAYLLWDEIIDAVTMAWMIAQLHTWEVQHRSSSGTQPDHPCPADLPTIRPSNMSAPASVEPVRISIPFLERTPQNFVSSRPDSRPSKSTLKSTRRMLIAHFPAFVVVEGGDHAVESNVVSTLQRSTQRKSLFPLRRRSPRSLRRVCRCLFEDCSSMHLLS